MRTVGKTWVITAAVVLTAACTSPPPPKEPVVSTDPAPVAEEFPEVGEIVEASWVEERMGVSEGRIEAPGPTDLRLSAVVKLRPEAVSRVMAGKNCHAGAPVAPEPLKALLPTGVAWLSCELPMTTKSRTAFVVAGSEQAFLTYTTM
ncbi:hypothetical protein [Amycolatopsis sp. BJA-103]|uniref:hypothetical protein n=1 Tax=Amycolatopsis sp. BJA-103 TaxID=1911175 RepID=UPI000C75709A|nr:hypothetical protein [Amycolatopsis sp. BJA-103]AUI56967.1 hypothetical protein BKN51_01240 [Amycolatopsis sp. BJA-103]PNE13309.1 hypothetical protein B1H26_40935 [Amycolatopsis sp. BJA-103]